MALTSQTDDSNGNTLKSRTIAGVRWSFADQLVTQGLNFLITVALARILSPVDFGLVGMAMVFTGFAALFADLGLGAALVQRKEVRPEHLDTAFWVNAFAGLFLTLSFAGASPWIARFFGEPQLAPLTAFLSLSFVLSSMSIVQRARLIRQMDFRRLAIIAWTAKVAVGGIGILLALVGFGVWSLAVNIVVSSALTSSLLWYWSSWRPRAVFDRGALRDLMGFSSHLFGFQTINYWLRNADNFLIGKYLGTGALGLYARAYALMLMPVQIGSTLGRVMFPALSTIQSDQERVGRVYLRMCQATAFVTAPLTFGLFSVAENFVLVLFGTNWEAVVPVLRILSLLGFLQSIGTLVGNLFLSTGRSDLLYWVGGITGVLGVGAMVLGLRHGVIGVAAYYAAVSCAAFLPQQQAGLRLVGLSVIHLLPKLWGPTAAASCMGALVYALGTQLPRSWPLPVHLALQIVTGVLVYGGIVHYARLEMYLELRSMLASRRRAGMLRHPLL